MRGQHFFVLNHLLFTFYVCDVLIALWLDGKLSRPHLCYVDHYLQDHPFIDLVSINMFGAFDESINWVIWLMSNITFLKHLYN